MKHRETGSLIENNKTHRTWSLIGYQRHKLNMKKPRQDDGASCIWQKNIRKTVAANPEIFAEHRYQIVHKHVTPSYVSFTQPILRTYRLPFKTLLTACSEMSDLKYLMRLFSNIGDLQMNSPPHSAAFRTILSR